MGQIMTSDINEFIIISTYGFLTSCNPPQAQALVWYNKNLLFYSKTEIARFDSLLKLVLTARAAAAVGSNKTLLFREKQITAEVCDVKFEDYLTWEGFL